MEKILKPGAAGIWTKKGLKGPQKQKYREGIATPKNKRRKKFLEN